MFQLASINSELSVWGFEQHQRVARAGQRQQEVNEALGESHAVTAASLGSAVGQRIRRNRQETTPASRSRAMTVASTASLASAAATASSGSAADENGSTTRRNHQLALNPASVDLHFLTHTPNADLTKLVSAPMHRTIDMSGDFHNTTATCPPSHAHNNPPTLTPTADSPSEDDHDHDEKAQEPTPRFKARCDAKFPNHVTPPPLGDGVNVGNEDAHSAGELDVADVLSLLEQDSSEEQTTAFDNEMLQFKDGDDRGAPKD